MDDIKVEIQVNKVINNRQSKRYISWEEKCQNNNDQYIFNKIWRQIDYYHAREKVIEHQQAFDVVVLHSNTDKTMVRPYYKVDIETRMSFTVQNKCRCRAYMSSRTLCDGDNELDMIDEKRHKESFTLVIRSENNDYSILNPNLDNIDSIWPFVRIFSLFYLFFLT